MYYHYSLYYYGYTLRPKKKQKKKTGNPYNYYGYHCAQTWVLVSTLSPMPLLISMLKSFRYIDKVTHQVY